jgi:hypothetical protein
MKKNAVAESAPFTDALTMRYRRYSMRAQASVRVQTAVRYGMLPRIKTLRCVDCGAKAAAYDHRDYRKPLMVQPVCGSCNARRPGALPWAPPAPRGPFGQDADRAIWRRRPKQWDADSDLDPKVPHVVPPLYSAPITHCQLCGQEKPRQENAA